MTDYIVRDIALADWGRKELTGRPRSARMAGRWCRIRAGCPVDATSWSSTAFSPETGLYYFLALEECVGKPTGYPDPTGQRFLRAVNIETGAIAWEVPQPGAPRAKTWSGVLEQRRDCCSTVSRTADSPPSISATADCSGSFRPTRA